MTDDKTLIEKLRSLADEYEWDMSVDQMAVLNEAANRLEQLTQGDVVVVQREPTEKMNNTHLKSIEVYSEAINDASRVAMEACLVPPDGGSPTKEEFELCSFIAGQIKNLAAINTASDVHGVNKVLVPLEPTGAMIMYGIHAHEKNDDLPDIGLGPKCVGIYKAMIAAAQEGK